MIQLKECQFVDLAELELSNELMEVIRESNITFGTNDRTLVLVENLVDLFEGAGYEERDFPKVVEVLMTFGNEVYVDLEN